MDDVRRAKLQRYAQIPEVFTPGAPIDDLELFAGRMPQVLEIINALTQRGQHVVLFGERGVGKTSLANILSQLFTEEEGVVRNLRSVGVNCITTDDFASLWRKIFRELQIETEGAPDPVVGRKPDPEDVRYFLENSVEKTAKRLLLVVDELDRLEDDEALSLLADTIKTLSDHSVEVTVVLVGVADSVDELIGDHKSVERALVQIQMPRMSRMELVEVMDKGLERLSLTIDNQARDRIARISEGLPHYVHLLSLHASQHAVMDDRVHIELGDVEVAIKEGTEKAQHSIKSSYVRATTSPQKGNLYAQVLLACALARKDDLGYFAPADVRRPMTAIMGRPYDIPAFARHLKGLAEGEGRGYVLQKRGTPHRFMYRFENPLLQPYVILQGLGAGLITEGLLSELQAEEHITSDAETASDQE